MPHLNTPCCKAHYGGRYKEIKIYRGPIYNQSGSGFFGDVFKRLVPLFTTHVLPHVLQTGQEIHQDIKGGTTIGEAIKKGVKRSFNRGKAAVFKKLRGEGARKTHKRRRRDYFSSV